MHRSGCNGTQSITVSRAYYYHVIPPLITYQRKALIRFYTYVATHL